MFLGHYGVAFALKRVEPRLSLASLFLSVALVDAMWGLFLITGWERARVSPGLTPVTQLEFISYPITHSLVAAFAWALFAGFIVYSWPTRDTSRHHWLKPLVIAIAVASHWFLDLIVHLPDLPLTGNESTKLGLGLWRDLPATLAVELALFLAGFAWYLRWRMRKGSVRLGRVLFLAGLLVLLYGVSLLGPPPDNMKLVGLVAIVGTLGLTALAGWADRDSAKGKG